MLSFNFTAFEVEQVGSTQYDYLEVYDGPDTNATFIGRFSGVDGTVPQALQPVTATNPGGALTFVFHSDFSVQKAGWEATINCSPTAIAQYNNMVGIYPNPNTGLFTVKLKNIQKASVKIYTTTGKLVYSKPMNTATMTVDMSGYAKGVYFVRVLSGDNTYVKKLILK